MDGSEHTAIIGLGYRVPDKIRGNDDPIFDYLHEHEPAGTDLFKGLEYRRVLEPPETVVDLMVDASQQALDDAGMTKDQVDLLIGYASVSEYNAPNGLLEMHHKMQLPESCRCMAVNTEYTNFLDAMKLGNDLIQVGTFRNALVTIGINWTGHMNYHEAVSIAAGDGAGAAVLGPSSDPRHFRLVDWENLTRSEYYGAFRMTPRPIDVAGSGTFYGAFTRPLMKLDGKFGEKAFKEFGMKVPPEVVKRLLERHGLTGGDISLVAHQVSSVVAEAWQKEIQAKHYVSTLAELADMVSASQAVNLAKCYDEIDTEYLVLMGVGMAMHATSLLYRRDRR